MTNQDNIGTYIPTLEEIEGKKKKEPSKSARKISVPIDLGNIINGNFLASNNSVKQLPFVFFLVMMCMLYIANTYYAERNIRSINKLTREIKQLHSDYITSKSDLMAVSKQSEISKKSVEQGLLESTQSPYKIVGALSSSEK